MIIGCENTERGMEGLRETEKATERKRDTGR